ncbi:MAG: CopG family transcriptional regulator, partial [Thermotogae bacterium]|nr:CopG family transcriptional regulator [Thermotogota bacterium]
MTSDKVTIKIPRPLYNKLKEIIKDTGYSSVTEFIVYVLRDLVSSGIEKREDEELTKEEIAAIKKRL